MFIMPANSWIWQYGRQLFGFCSFLGLVFTPLPSLAAERVSLVAGDTT